MRTLFCEPHHSFPPTGTILVTGLLGVPRTNVWEDWGSQKLPADWDKESDSVTWYLKTRLAFTFMSYMMCVVTGRVIIEKGKENVSIWSTSLPKGADQYGGVAAGTCTKCCQKHLNTPPFYLLLSGRLSPLHWPKTQTLCCPNICTKKNRYVKFGKHTINVIWEWDSAETGLN